jgi:hypothetical protein
MDEKLNIRNENHALTRGLIVPQIIDLIASKHHISKMKALGLFYTSSVGASYSNDESGLYAQSPLYVFSLFEQVRMTEAKHTSKKNKK